MILGKINKLKVVRIKAPGAFLEDIHGKEVLLPRKYLVPIEDFEPGTFIDVFLMKDSNNRIVSTTETPKLFLNDIAFLKVVEINSFGAFVDWGLDKDLFVPFKEQRSQFEIGKKYGIQLKYDEKTDRLYGSEKFEKYLIPCKEDLRGTEISGVVWRKTRLGFSVILENQYLGLLFHNRDSKLVQIGETYSFHVSNVRDDGKLDLQFEEPTVKKFDNAFEFLLNEIRKNHVIPLGDNSNPEEIRNQLGMSKKLFKQTIGKLYKAGHIKLFPNKLEINEKLNPIDDKDT